MRRTLSRLFARLGLYFIKPHPTIIRTLEKALSQQALFQLEMSHEKDRCHHQYLAIKACTHKSLTLVSPTPFFMVAASWQHKSFLFRCLVQVNSDKPPLLHKFRSKILSVGKDKRTITVAIPADIVAMEQRRAVRITPQPKHLPGLVVWGVHKNQGGAKGTILHHNVLLDMESKDLELRKTLANVSARGMRLSLPQKVVAQNKEWLEIGRRLIIQMVFSSSDFPNDSKHMFVAKICNTRMDDNRHELGIEFLAARVSDPKPRWKPLDKNGCELMARVIHFLQVRYYAEAKQRVVDREGLISAGTDRQQQPRKSA